ncbi:MAG: hypothetical protein ACE5IY_01130 [bacterium]
MFARRNSLTLAIIWILILIVGTFMYLRDANKLVSAIDQEKKVSELLSQSQNEVRRLTDVESIHEELSKHWQQSPKRIISADEPSFTLSYINWIVSTYNLNIYYDFVLNSKDKTDLVTKFTYTLAGEGPYNDIVQLIWHLTYEPILYIIDTITLTRRQDDFDYVKFAMKLNGFSVDSQSEMTEDLADFSGMQTNALPRQYDIFKALVVPKPIVEVKKTPPKPRPKPQLPKRKPGEIDVQKASLKAVTSGSVFMADESGTVKELKVGDSVYLGRLVRINQQRNEAEFMLTKFGKTERIILTINERN